MQTASGEALEFQALRAAWLAVHPAARKRFLARTTQADHDPMDVDSAWRECDLHKPSLRLPFEARAGGDNTLHSSRVDRLQAFICKTLKLNKYGKPRVRLDALPLKHCFYQSFTESAFSHETAPCGPRAIKRYIEGIAD
jgi:hypothetical protein